MSVKHMTISWALQASMTLSSRMELPGWATYLTPLRKPLDVVTEGEESIGSQCHILIAGEPGLLLFHSEDLGLNCEKGFPLAVVQDIHILLANVKVDGIVAVRAADALLEGEIQDLGTLSQVPVVGFLAGKACAVDAGLLTGTDTDSLSALDKAHGIALGVFESDQGDRHIVAGCRGRSLFFVTILEKRASSTTSSLRPCSKVIP